MVCNKRMHASGKTSCGKDSHSPPRDPNRSSADAGAVERSIGRPGPFPPPRFGRICPPAHARSLGSFALHAVCAIGRIEPVSAKKWLGNMAPFPWPLVFDRTFPFAFPEIACEEKGMGKGMRGKGMGTDRRFNSLAHHSLAHHSLAHHSLAPHSLAHKSLAEIALARFA